MAVARQRNSSPLFIQSKLPAGHALYTDPAGSFWSVCRKNEKSEALMGFALSWSNRFRISIQVEVDFYSLPDRHGLAVFHAGPELVLHHRFNGLFVQSHAQ